MATTLEQSSYVEAFDIESTLKKRLDEVKLQRDKDLATIKELLDELQKMFAKSAKQPRLSMTALDEQLKTLEAKRTSKSMALAKEKEILREIRHVEKQKAQLEEHNARELKVQEKKNLVTELREAVKVANTTIEELAAGLAKVQLAKKLGCAPQNLSTRTIECPEDKLGMVIGKQGANRKQIMENSNVSLEIDRETRQIQLVGTESSLDAATKEITRIIRTVDEEITVPPETVEYLTSKHITAFSELRQRHPNIRLDVARNDTKVRMSGMPEDVAAARDDLESMEIIARTKSLAPKEVPLILGKQGTRIEKYVMDHLVSINIKGDDKEGSITIVGPPANVEAALEEITTLLVENEDITESIRVKIITRRALLANAGAPIKELQKKVNAEVNNGIGGVLLSFDKETANQEISDLVVRTRRIFMPHAKKVVEDAITDIEANAIHIDVDPVVIPSIIGKGGEILKKIREGTSVNIEVDRTLGRVSMQSTNKEELAKAEEDLRAIVAENQVLRVDFSNPELSRAIFQTLLRSSVKDEVSKVVRLHFDDEINKLVLRGSAENLKKAAELLSEFMENNYMEEVTIVQDDEQVLLAGGASSAIVKLSQETGAVLSCSRERSIVSVRGTKDNVADAIKKLNTYLNGGEGFAVCRVLVTEQTLGVVIGKKGKKRMELESKYEGVRITTHQNSHHITIRGPDTLAEECRIEIVKLVSGVTVTESVAITAVQHQSLSKSDVIKNIAKTIPVQFTLNEDSVKLRGVSMDVRDAMILLNESLTGSYEARIDLDASQLSKVRSTCRDPSHFERMEKTSEAKVILDVAESAIKITGKRSNVKRAKLLVVGFLDFLLPSNFARIKIPKPLHSSIGRASTLADVCALTGAMVSLDRDLSSIQIQSSELEKVQKAVDLLKEKITEAEKLVYTYSFLDTESWMIPFLIGKDGKQINELRRSSGADIQVSKEERTVTVIGEDEEKVAAARSSLDALIDKARRECVLFDIPEAAIPAFVGKAGANIKQLQATHGVEITKVGRKESLTYKIFGNEAGVAAAKVAVEEWIATWERTQAGRSIPLEKRHVPIVVGKGGESIRAIEKEFGCHLDIDRDANTVTLRGGSAENRDKAVEKINEMIAAADATAAEKRREKRVPDSLPNAPQSENNDKQRNRSRSPLKSDDQPKTRASEFPAKPVGLASTNGQKHHKDFADDTTVQGGTAAGRRLFSMLVSPTVPMQKKAPAEVQNISSTASGSAPDDMWDSSTVSSNAVSSGTDDEGVAPAVSTHRFASSSGFSVRV